MTRGLLGLALVGLLCPAVGVHADDGLNVLGQTSVRTSGSRTHITVRAKRPPSFTAYRLDQPARLVVDVADSKLEGGKGAEGAIRADLATSRTAAALDWRQLDDEMGRSSRLTIELKPDASYDARVKGNELLIVLSPTSEATAAKASGGRGAKPTPAPRSTAHAAAPSRSKASADARPQTAAAVTPAPTSVAATRPERTSGSQITGVEFRDEADAVRVVIQVRGKPQVRELPASDNEATLVLGPAQLAPGQARTLDTSAFHGPVAAVSTFADPSDPKGQQVRINARLGAATTPRLRQEENQVIWEFPKPAVAASYPPPRVAGFSSGVLPLQVGPPPATPGTTSLSQPTRGARKKFTGTRIDLDFKDVDIHNMLRVFTKVGGVNIVTTDDVKGTVTVSMHDVPWDQALDAILKAKGLGQVRDGNVIRIALQSQIEKEVEAELSRNKQKVDLSPIITRLIQVSYADASKVLPRVQDILSSRGHVSFDDRTNTLIISDIAGNLDLAAELIHTLDTQTPQVQIEARIVEARTNYARDLGIQWGGSYLASAGTGNPTGLLFPSSIGAAGGSQDQVTNTNGLLNGQAQSPNYVVNLPAPTGTNSGGALGLTFGSVAGNLNINLRLSALENTGNIRILSAPKVTTLDNIESNIEQGIAVPVTVISALGPNTVYVDAKLSLVVKPHITNDGSILMNVAVTNNQPDFSRVGTLGSPAILKNQAKTQLLVKDGDTAVIGGIYTRTTTVSYNKIPGLGDIPVLGWLFKRKRTTDDRSELLIFITPKVLERTGAATASR